MAVHEENAVMRSIQLDAELRRDLEDHRIDERDLQMTLGGSDKGKGKWKKINEKLFKSRILKPLLIALTFKYIRSDVYTAHSMARVMDLHHDFNLWGLDNLMNIDHTVTRAERLLW
jgi:hypothetical protein